MTYGEMYERYNTILLKVAENMDRQILAMSIYTSYLTGLKCVGTYLKRQMIADLYKLFCR